MKVNARWVVYPLLLAVAASAVYVRYRHETLVAPPGAAGTEIAPGDPQPDIAEAANAPDAMTQSHWMSDRVRRYSALLKGWQCDVVVAPMQVEGMGFDRPTRDVMSLDIAAAISGAGCVADPLLIGSALGDGLRRYPLTQVQSLAAELGAKTLVVPYAGHDRSGLMRVTLQVYRRDDPSQPFSLSRKISVDDVQYTLTVAPVAAFHARLPDILASAGLSSSRSPPSAEGMLPAELPGPTALRGDATTPIVAAAEYLLLGALAPHPFSHASDRLYAKAYTALSGAGDGALARRLRARALLHLGERPYALEVIANDHGVEVDGLRAILNGDLKSAKAALEDDKDAWDRAYLALEVFDLQVNYREKGEQEATAALAAFGPDWSTLITARLSDSDRWRVPQSVELKRSLDALFPIKGESLDDIRTGSAIAGRYDDMLLVDELAVRHIRSSMQKDAAKWCCGNFALNPSAADLLDVFASRSERELMQYAEYYDSVQGKPDVALKMLEKYHDFLDGFGDAERLRAHAEWSIKWRGNRDSAADREERIRKAARVAVVADPGQNDASSSTLWYLLQTPIEPFARILGDAYCEDYPMRASWYGAPDTLRARLLFSTNDVVPISDLIKHSQGAERDALVAELDHRYVGNIAATSLRLDYGNQHRANNPADLREEIAADPDNWNLYDRLARLDIRRGEYADASKVALSFPQFASKSGNTVGRGNDAFDVGKMLYFRGAFEEARPLLKLAADYHNGSGASTISHAMLAVLDGDLSTAAQDRLEVARHYQLTEQFHAFLEFVFASGDRHAGWEYFEQLTRQYKAAPLWMAAMVGHRAENISAATLRTWLLDHAKDREPAREDDSVVLYALAEQLTDRGAPSDTFVDDIKTLSGTSGVKASANGKSFSGALSLRERVVGPSGFGRERRAAVAGGSEIPSRYVLFAEAYAALRNGRSAEAAGAFDRLAGFYNIESNGEWGVVLPYFAFAAADSGDALGLKPYLESKAGDNDAWGAQLSLAIFDALGNQHDAAATLLDKAFRDRPDTGRWPVDTAYQYAEICIWLYERTKDDRYRQRALRWAHDVARMRPTCSWPYALIARFGDDTHERATTLNKALYLDAQSNWIVTVPSDIRKASKTITPNAAEFFALRQPSSPTQL